MIAAFYLAGRTVVQKIISKSKLIAADGDRFPLNKLGFYEHARREDETSKEAIS